jgi:hypothetical protein
LRTILPASPLSYDGLIVKVVWCVRVRLFLAGNRQCSADQTFQLGSVPRPASPPARSEVVLAPTRRERQGVDFAL